MNKDSEKKLDELLAKMPKRDYDLDAWLNEDETAEFDRIVNQRCGDDMYADSLDSQPQHHRHMLWRWVAAAACLFIIIGIGVTMKFATNGSQEKDGQMNISSKTLAVEEGKEIQTPTLTLPHEEKEVDEPNKAVAEPNRKETAPRKAMAKQNRTITIPINTLAQTSQQDKTADTLGSAIWQREENVVLALQMLSDCEQTIQREEQALRNNIIRATFNATPQPANARLMLNENGDYIVVEDKGPVIIEL